MIDTFSQRSPLARDMLRDYAADSTACTHIAAELRQARRLLSRPGTS